MSEMPRSHPGHGLRRIMSRHATLFRLGFVFALLALLWLPSLAQAQITRNFTIRYSANVNGDFAAIGNTVTYCDLTAGNASCNSAPGGSSIDNQSVGTIVNVDVNSDSSTFNSSSADLSVPAGSTIRFAGLYWGGRSSFGLARAGAIANPKFLRLCVWYQRALLIPRRGHRITTRLLPTLHPPWPRRAMARTLSRTFRLTPGLNGGTFNNSGANCRNATEPVAGAGGAWWSSTITTRWVCAILRFMTVMV